MSKLYDALMSVVKEDFNKMEQREVELPRLSKKLGEKFKATVKQMPTKRFIELTSQMIDRKGNPDLTKQSEVMAKVIAESLVDPKIDSDIINKFCADTPVECVEKIFPYMDMQAMFEEISVMSGVSDDYDDPEEAEEVKNL